MAKMTTSQFREEIFQLGETPIENAPQILLKNGRRCIPQHFLTYNHNRSSIESILSNIQYDERYLLFVSEDGNIPFIQVGIVGFDNYKPKSQQAGQKIVFGRKWRVEPNLPTSEIIQTCFLALQKAREHEIRELFKLRVRDVVATPFNSHHDLPLLAINRDVVEINNHYFNTLADCVQSTRLDGHRFFLMDIEHRRNDQWIVDIGHRGEIISLILSELKENCFLFELMDALIKRSSQHVEENFLFKGFARFSRKNSVAALAEFSANLRSPQSAPDCANHGFDVNLAQEKYDTDSSRVPQLTNSAYSNALRARLKSLNIKTGFIPK
jgi:hypothetical protein